MKSLIHFIDTMTISKALTVLLTPFLATMTTAAPALLGLCLIMGLDLITGVRKSLYEKNVKSPFKKEFWLIVSSSGFRRTWRKATEYGIGILTFSVLQTFFKIDATMPFIGSNLIETIILTAIVIEAYSIFENLRDSSTNSKFTRFLKLLFNGVVSKLPEKLQKVLKNN
jgi:hypothetical protein